MDNLFRAFAFAAGSGMVCDEGAFSDRGVGKRGLT